jgi:hypothetical protein
VKSRQYELETAWIKGKTNVHRILVGKPLKSSLLENLVLEGDM